MEFKNGLGKTYKVPEASKKKEEPKVGSDEYFAEARQARIASYRKYACLNESDVITEDNIDDWALKTTAVMNKISSEELLNELLNRDVQPKSDVINEEKKNDTSFVESCDEQTWVKILKEAAGEGEDGEVLNVKPGQIEPVLDHALDRCYEEMDNGKFVKRGYMFVGEPGSGKSEIIEKWIQTHEFDGKYGKHKLNMFGYDGNTFNPQELGFIPTGEEEKDDKGEGTGYSKTLASSALKGLNTPYSVLWIDEINRCSGPARSFLLKLITTHRLPNAKETTNTKFCENFLFVVGAINPEDSNDDEGEITELGKAFRDRFNWYMVESNIDTFGAYMKNILEGRLNNYESKLKQEPNSERFQRLVKKYKGCLGILEAILKSGEKKKIMDNKSEMAQIMNDPSQFTFTTSRGLEEAFLNSDGTKEGFLKVWGESCNYMKKPVIKRILKDYVDVGIPTPNKPKKKKPKPEGESSFSSVADKMIKDIDDLTKNTK